MQMTVMFAEYLKLIFASAYFQLFLISTIAVLIAGRWNRTWPADVHAILSDDDDVRSMTAAYRDQRR